jgi:hypothetical protein
MADKEETRTYIIQLDHEVIKVEIPSDWKVTYSRIVPSERAYNDNPFCLRIYETKEKQRAALVNVKNFFDASVKIQYLDYNQEKKEVEWIDIDGERFLAERIMKGLRK